MDDELTYRAWNKETLLRIEKQTTTTNGRVTKLERFQSYTLGFCAAIGILILPIIFALFQNGKI